MSPQIYAPIEEGPPSSFHRSLYVFCCLSCGNHFRAISSHLPRENAEYPSCAVSTFFESKEAFWSLWRQQQQRQLQQQTGAEREEGPPGSSSEEEGLEVNECSSTSASSGDTGSTTAGHNQHPPQHKGKTIDENAKIAIIKQLQRGERLRQVCCCPVCGLGGGETVGETERAAAAALLQEQLQRRERRLDVLLRQQQEEGAAAGIAEEDNTKETAVSGVVDLDLEDFEGEDTEADQRGLLLLDAAQIQGGWIDWEA